MKPNARIDAAGFADELARRLAKAPDPALDPSAVADLFRQAYGESAHASALGRALRAAFFRRTVAHAAETAPFYRAPAYRAFLAEARPAEAAYPPLASLPLLTRADLQARPDEFLSSATSTAWLSHTAGSTGAPVTIARAREEVAFQQHYFQRMMDEVADRLPVRPLSLTFPNAYHGVPTPLPSLGKVFVAGVTDDVLIDDAVRVLGEEYCFPGYEPRISILSGLGFHIAFLTAYLLQRGLDPRSYEVRAINVTGAHLPRALHRFLEGAWGARINDRFTLTEIVGGGTRQSPDEPFRVDPYCLAEAVDDEARPVTDGVGLLVMSSLYPFSQRQPVLRYATGDLIRVRAHDGLGVTAFDFLGKTRNCLSLRREGRTLWVLHSASLNDALTEHPDVRLYDWFSNVRKAADPSVGSQPLVRAAIEEREGTPPVVAVETELRYAPLCYPDRLRVLQASVQRALLRGNPELEALVAADSLRLEIRFVGPGQLGDSVAFKV
ncbi:MAG: hypothetical protein QOH86_2036 [Sphingomonadales bacterium]|nr:hypothetical protein [Sphingomonadales bacterium]